MGGTGLDPLDVAVLTGGKSTERTISLQSGAAVATALRSRGHRVVCIDPADTNLSEYAWDGIDVVFIALHGTFGEDGRVQQVLEQAGVPFTGSNSTASRLAFSKSASKERFLQHGVPTPPYVLIHETDSPDRIHRHAQELGYPLVIKPDCQGSSFGVSCVLGPNDLADALARCFHFDAFGVMESAVDGTEWTVGILDEMILPPIQIVTNRSFFDYRAKYKDESTQYLFEFDVEDRTVEEIIDVASRACCSLQVQGLARVDLRLDKQMSPWVLEVNTIPGLTDHSLVPKAALRLGIDFGELCERTLTSCLRAASTRPQSP